MTHMSEQTGHLPFLSLRTQQTWAQVGEIAPDRGGLNMTAQLQEITTRRHRLYLIRRTLRLHALHYHLRIAGLLPARNKMLGCYRVIDPPCYRLAHIPKLLQRATAQLHDNTTIYPLASGDEEAFLSLSGIIFVGRTADQRCVLHEHLVNLGLAGPPAPILQWAGHFQEGPRNTHVLPFRSLAVLPAELLAIPVPTTSWAFEVAPVMSLSEWEAYRRRSTSTVLIMTTESNLNCIYRLFTEGISRILPVIVAFWQLGCFLASCLRRWQSGLSKPPHPRPMHPTVLSLCDQAKWKTPVQGMELGTSSSNLSTQSSSTELRATPPKLRDTLKTLWNALKGVNETSPLCSTSAATKVHRPTVLVRGCLPKGSQAHCLSE